MSNLVLPIPESLTIYRGHLKEFFAGMMLKLDVNSHKNTPEMDDVPEVINKLLEEVQEFRDQLLKDPSDENTLVELMDAANFSFLAYIAVKNKYGTKSRKDRIVDEFLLVDTKRGKVFCKKPREGYRYKIGDEIKGSLKQGEREIELQKVKDVGYGVSVPRSHVVWYAEHGMWPTELVHIDGVGTNDAIDNLWVKPAQNKDKLPRFVVRHKDGKYGYHRHHKGVILSTGRYDTSAQAATEGKLKWIARVKESDLT